MRITTFFAFLATIFIAAAPLRTEAACPNTVVLLYANSCPHSQRVLEYMKEIHVTVPVRDVYQDPAAKEELRTKGGLMQVPCLLIDGKPLYDDELIIQWIKENRECLNK